MAKNTKKIKPKTKPKNSSCKVCKHEHLIEIETALIIEKKSSRAVEEMIKKNGWQPISYVTLLSHVSEHIDTRRELVLRYLDEKRKLLESEIAPDEDPEYDELTVRLNELKKLDTSLQEADILLRMSSKALQEQLSLRIETGAKNNGKGTTAKVVGVDRKKADAKKAYVPIQRDLIALYKGASEELRMTAKAKLDMLGIGADYKQVDSVNTLVDIVMDVSKRKKNKNIEKE